MALLRDDSLKDDFFGKLNTFMAAVDENMEQYEKGILSEEDRRLFNELEPQWEKYKAHLHKAMSYASEGQYDKVQDELLGEADAISVSVQDAIGGLVTYNNRIARERAENNTEMARTAEALMFSIIIAGVILAVLLGFFVSRIISRPIKKIVAAAEQLAEGNMNISFDLEYKDETGQLTGAFRNLVRSTRELAAMVERIADGDLTADIPVRSEKDLLGRRLSEMAHNINRLILEISAAAEQVSAGSKQISDASMGLSQGATEQASSIEELSASIEQISSQTKVNAENADKANELAKKAKEYAVTGNTQMKEMLRAIDDINESSSNINKIIKVIDDIAFQTNILALNAAVEAAKAGQHGKGFAVVAEEVRTLAGRSANAAKETTAMIGDSIKKSEEGTRVAKETAEALEKIVDSVEVVSDLVSEINNASNEQAAAITQINQGIMQASQVVQENSSTAEEGAAASEELSGQAQLLYDMVSKFKLRRGAKSHGIHDEIDPDVARMLDNMSAKAKNDPAEQRRDSQKPDAPKVKITLNDMEFGKY